MDAVVNVINGIFAQIGEAGRGLIHSLPASPLRWYAVLDNQILSWVNWVIPIGEMVVVAEAWLICIGVWYMVRVVLRWLKGAAG